MKGVDTLIAAVLIILISVAGIAIVLESTQPSVGRLQEISLMKEGKDILTKIDNAIRTVAQEGEGSTRVLQLSVSDGSYLIDVDEDAVIFYMDSRAQLIGVGISKTEENINMFGGENFVSMNISYTNINITGGGRFGKGYHNLIIRNNGYDFVNQKQLISISFVAQVLPPTAFVNQYNQYGLPYIVKGGIPSGNHIDLNILGEGLTYDIPKSGSKGYYFYQRRPNAYSGIGATRQTDAYNYDSIGAASTGVTSQNDWWNNTIQNSLGTIINATWGTGYRGTGSGTGNRNDDTWSLLYGIASTPGNCGSVGSWTTFISGTGNPGSTWRWVNLTNTTPVSWNDINNTCWRMTYIKIGPSDTWILEIDAFHIDFNYSASNYGVEVWHNSSQIDDGNINYINVEINFTTNISDYYSLQIYDWSNSQWFNCQNGLVSSNTPTQWWCNMASNPMNYNSSDRVVRIRINSTDISDIGLLKEDYIQYFVGYTA